ncbi:EthD domain-containing protein [Lentzea sp. NPDC060358]|uniref:EthD domain-containing protein n=1 Tax=Lentzea sp. NPDC060358 TaxID=3347103 RepID=UPI00365BBF59
MITVVVLLKAKEGLTREEFVDHYENRHVPLVLGVAPMIVHYARHYLPEADMAGHPSEYDCMTQLKFEDRAARRAWLTAVLAEGSGVAEDEERFLDRSATRSWTVDERVS